MAEGDYLGGFSLAAWRGCPAAPVIASTDMARGFFEPERKPTFDARIGVAFQPFRWEEGAPWIWLFCTVGLSSLTQVQKDAPLGRQVAKVSPHLELCAAMREPAASPRWEGFREAWGAGALSTYGAVPPIITRFALVAQDFASWIVRDGDAFAFGDHVENACLAPGFPSALLVPPVPELVVSGLWPFDARKGRSEIVLGRWADRDALHAAGDHQFVQVAPLEADEYEAARWDGWRFFLQALLATDEEMRRGVDASAHIVDLGRASRRALF
jgi:hypothetical protein